MNTTIKNVVIYDGLGSIPFQSNLYIEEGKISKISKHFDDECNIVIDGLGFAVCPGFIDVHSHSDLEIFKKEKLHYAIRQGITTEVIGQDGISAAPCNESIKEYLYEKVMTYSGNTENKHVWTEFKDYKKSINESTYDGKIENLLGHGTARMFIANNQDRKLTKDEIENMKNIVRKSLMEGAIGVSFSMINTPSSFGDEDEIVEVCKVVSEFDGIAMMYFGDEHNLLLETIDLLARIGKKSNARMHISQLKAVGNRNHGKMKIALEKIDKYVKEGIEISYDCYPYIAINSPLDILLGKNSLDINEIIETEDLYINAIKEIDNNIESYGGEENIIISSCSKYSSFIGKRLKEIRSQMGIGASEVILKLLREDNNALALFFAINNNELEILLKQPYLCICTDGIISDFPHPRVYGTFPRMLGNYARNMKLFSIEEVIRKMTSEPARRLRLWDRGILREGMAADIVLFNPNEIRDGNSYINPKKFPIGIKAVWVDGIMKYAEL
ncbi:MAG: dan [Bacillota bacterium]|nr:dan [Bacillota bacterium]